MRRRLPPWLVKKYPPKEVQRIKRLLRAAQLHTVCEEARCPNIGECFSHSELTFMILGDRCTRNCRFCAVDSLPPDLPDSYEPKRVAQLAAELELRYVVITSVTRDDLPDGGAEHFARTVETLQRTCPETRIELLIPDLGGMRDALAVILATRPDVLGHNLETVPRLYPSVRPQANYQRSLNILLWSKEIDLSIYTKSALMLGMGESQDEVLDVLNDLRGVGCDFVTLGQYLQPTKASLPVADYLPPKVFDEYACIARELGFKQVVSQPFARSSYLADQWVKNCEAEGVTVE